MLNTTPTRFLIFVLVLFVLAASRLGSPSASAGENEFTGSLDGVLVAHTEELEQIVFRPLRDLSKVKFEAQPEQGSHITAARLYDPLRDKSSMLTVLVEPDEEDPFLYVDLDLNSQLSENERLLLRRDNEPNPYILQTTVDLPFKSGIFKTYPIFIQYFKGVQWDELGDDERLVLQSKDAFARGKVDFQGKQIVVQYQFNPQSKKISTNNGWLGVDSDDDGEIDLDHFSPEAAEAREETVVFRIGSRYVSTRKVDLEKNQIVMREHSASDYKRVELTMGAELPDFTFTDFDGKKRKLSEFRGKYVLLDFWAAWCGPCRRELPYQKTAYSRFQDRGFEILGMNNDFEPDQVKPWLRKNGLTWPQATMTSIRDLENRYRIHSFPTTLLLDDQGKIVSLGQTKKQQLSLRGRELLKSLDQVLPP
jgi:thiol-disulfide isomerase/thioredoxin